MIKEQDSAPVIMAFELETQRLNGYSFNQTISENPIFQEEDWNRDRLHSEDSIFTSFPMETLPSTVVQTLLNLSPSDPLPSYRSPQNLWRYLNLEGQAAKNFTRQAFTALWESKKTRYMKQRKADIPYFMRLLEPDTESFTRNSDLYNGYEGNDFTLETDGSVSGPEIKPREPSSSIPDLVNLVRKIYRFNPIVDTGCSFHVHLSKPGVKHKYGIDFQKFMYLYLTRNIHRVPEPVLERWKKIPKGEATYFKFEITSDRYAFVAYRHEFNTWEFRCWGNIREPEHARICLELSREAWYWAYNQHMLRGKLCSLSIIELKGMLNQRLMPLQATGT